MNPPPPLILASASPRRRELLALLGQPFTVLPAEVTEIPAGHLTPLEACLLNAHHKARAVAKQHPDALVIGADTEVCLGSRTFGKPANRAEAATMLRDLAGRTHQVITGISLMHLRGHHENLFAVATDVTMHPFDPARIHAYLDRIDPLDKAGAYAVQEHAHLVIENLAGSLTNVVGLPVHRLGEELQQAQRNWFGAGE